MFHKRHLFNFYKLGLKKKNESTYKLLINHKIINKLSQSEK